MSMILILVAVMLVYFCVTRWKNVYNIVFLCGAVSFCLLILSLFLYINVLSNYSTDSRLEYIIYRYINSLNFSFFNIKLIVNIAIAIFMASSTLICMENNSIFSKKKKYLLYGGFYAVSALYLMYYNSPDFCERIFLIANTAETATTGAMLERIIMQINNIVLAGYVIMPCVNLIIHIRKTKLRFRKKYYGSIMAVHLVMGGGICVMLYGGMLNFFHNNFNLYDFRLLYAEAGYDVYFDTIRAVLFVFILSLMLAVKYRVVDVRDFIKKYSAEHVRTIDINELRHVFHTYKNAMFSIGAISDMAMDNDDPEQVRAMLRKIKKNSENYAKHVSVFLDINRNARKMNENVSITECIVRAESLLAVPPHIKVVKKYQTADDIVIGNSADIEQLFYNLMSNAIDAINKKGGDGIITIELWNDEMCVCAMIEDNGTGIGKKNIKHIFTPFYTTTQSNKNWGLGLSHVKTIVERHGGYIDVVSREGVYTRFQLMIPLGSIKHGRSDYD